MFLYGSPGTYLLFMDYIIWADSMQYFLCAVGSFIRPTLSV